MTITDVIRQVLTQSLGPLTAPEIHEAIVKGSLFEFNSTSAASIVRTQIRRHCEGIQTQSVSAKKYFRLVGSNRYELLDSAEKR